MVETEQSNKPEGAEVQLVVFRLGTEEYGAEIHEIREIIKRDKITKIPSAPAFVEGIINLRGRIVVVINLLKRFGTFDEAEHAGTHVVISEMNGNSFGILVDAVNEVLRVSRDDIKKAPSIIASKVHIEYIQGVAIVGDRLVILLDLEKVLSEKELVEMAELTKNIKTGDMAAKKEPVKPRISDEEVERRFKEHFAGLAAQGIKPDGTPVRGSNGHASNGAAKEIKSAVKAVEKAPAHHHKK